MDKKFTTQQLDKMLEDVGASLDTPLEAFLIGGLAMIKNGMKTATKDVDIVFSDKASAQKFIDASKAQGFYVDSDLPFEYKEMGAMTVLKDSENRRFDIFVTQVLKKLYVTDDMRERANAIQYSNLTLSIASNEDIFLFKSITERDHDIDDMILLAQTGNIDWAALESEVRNQPNSWRWMAKLSESLGEMEGRASIISPLQKKLEYDVELAPGIERIISVTEGQPFTFSTARDGLLRDEESAREVLKYMLEHNIIEEATDGYRFIPTGLLEPE